MQKLYIVFVLWCSATTSAVEFSIFSFYKSFLRVKCPVQVRDQILPQVQEFKYLVVMSDGRREIDRRIGTAAAVKPALYWSIVVKRELSVKAQFSIYWLIYIPTLTCGHKLWVVCERTKL